MLYLKVQGRARGSETKVITAPLSVVSTVCRLPTSASDMQLLCDAELSQFWKELPFSGIAEGSRVMVLPAMPSRSGLPELKSMYVRESYERLTDMATDGGLHLISWIHNSSR